MLIAEQLEPDRKTGDELRILTPQVGDCIVDVVMQTAAAVDPPVKGLRVRFENGCRLPATVQKYLDMAIHDSL